MATKIEEAKAALWGQLIDSGELGDENANTLVDALIAAVRESTIRDASAGTCHIGMGYNLTLNKPSTPDGDYDLIPIK